MKYSWIIALAIAFPSSARAEDGTPAPQDTVTMPENPRLSEGPGSSVKAIVDNVGATGTTENLPPALRHKAPILEDVASAGRRLQALAARLRPGTPAVIEANANHVPLILTPQAQGVDVEVDVETAKHNLEWIKRRALPAVARALSVHPEMPRILDPERMEQSRIQDAVNREIGRMIGNGPIIYNFRSP